MRAIDAIFARNILNPVGPEFMAPPSAMKARAVA
jgi:hypothetical protein